MRPTTADGDPDAAPPSAGTATVAVAVSDRALARLPMIPLDRDAEMADAVPAI